ncbi:MAG: prepilin-type N-terminal cleavage/methylation domain-containing protein [Pyrinomonadaceae bacterium]
MKAWFGARLFQARIFRPASADHSSENRKQAVAIVNGQAGFSLVEVIVAMVILLVALLGVFVVFTWAITYNYGNSSRTEALAILQQQVENMRSAKFTPAVVDTSLTGGNKPVQTVVLANGNAFVVQTVVDDDPFTNGVQIDNTSTLKEVEITVSLARPTPGWQSSVPATVVLRRARSN